MFTLPPEMLERAKKLFSATCNIFGIKFRRPLLVALSLVACLQAFASYFPSNHAVARFRVAQLTAKEASCPPAGISSLERFMQCSIERRTEELLEPVNLSTLKSVLVTLIAAVFLRTMAMLSERQRSTPQTSVPKKPILRLHVATVSALMAALAAAVGYINEYSPGGILGMAATGTLLFVLVCKAPAVFRALTAAGILTFAGFFAALSLGAGFAAVAGQFAAGIPSGEAALVLQVRLLADSAFLVFALIVYALSIPEDLNDLGLD